ncbi:hypothetical protein WJX81_000716 [Elliptochloris bilobata]|uniref:Calcineurin-like phosphoesterase domain-containing protein n=1 Tax=Elliptochloris bilobata TaxID=381761 RepID=A0AAW1RAY5_9CHLO
MRAYACVVAVLFAAALATAQQPAASETVDVNKVATHIADTIGALHPTVPPTATPSPVTTQPAATTTPAPTTTPATINFTVPVALANSTQADLLQYGTGKYTGDSEPPTANSTIARFVVIGDVGRQAPAEASVGMPQCSTAFAGDNNLQGGLQQNETALLMEQVCKIVGGCSFVLNTGDNFYECGVYPNDYSRFQSDWINVYQTPFTPTIAPLPWFNVIGNHDIVINGSVETEVKFDTSGASPVNAASPLPSVTKLWNAPAPYYSKDYSINGVTIRGIVLDASPFITAYNNPTNKYHSGYYVTNHNQAYEQAQIAFLRNALATSTATYNFVSAHYPLFGGATQYGANGSAYPGEFNFWADVLASINSADKKVVTYFNGHDHSLTLGDPTTNAAQPQAPVPTVWNGYITYQTSGAGSWGEPADSCNPSLYSNGGNGGFIIVTATSAQWRSDYYTLGSTYPQCTVTSYADKRPPTFSPNCALGKPNACCSVNGGAGCYR